MPEWLELEHIYLAQGSRMRGIHIFFFIQLQMIDDRAIFLTSSCWWRPDGWHSNASLYHAHSVEEER